MVFYAPPFFQCLLLYSEGQVVTYIESLLSRPERGGFYFDRSGDFDYCKRLN